MTVSTTTRSTIASRQGRGESERKRSSASRLFQQSTNGDFLLSLGLRRSQPAATATVARSLALTRPSALLVDITTRSSRLSATGR
jgi:hypothetical protein